ncbi:MAG: cell division protein FtsL [Planctomycetota bacterium]|jgi:cell division protein FtsL
MKLRKKLTKSGMTRIRRNGKVGVANIKKKQRVRDAAIVLSLFVIISLFCVWSRVSVLQTGYRIHNLARDYQNLEDKYRSIRLEVATLKSPNRLVPLARKRLGLKQPSPSQVVIVPETIRIAEQGQ